MVNLRSKTFQKASLSDEGDCTCKYCNDCACYLTPPSTSYQRDIDPKTRTLNSKINDTISIQSYRPFRDFINKELKLKSSMSKALLKNIQTSSNLNSNTNNNNITKDNRNEVSSQTRSFLQIPCFIKLISINLLTNFILTLVSVLVLAIGILKFDQHFFAFNNLDDFYNKLKKEKGKSN